MSGVALVYASTFWPAGLVAPADATHYSAAVPRPAASSFMPLRKASLHPAQPALLETPRTTDRCMDVASPLPKAGQGVRCGEVKGETAQRSEDTNGSAYPGVPHARPHHRAPCTHNRARPPHTRTTRF
jgi:hypothetical protein